jgi:hypothetical protein
MDLNRLAHNTFQCVTCDIIIASLHINHSPVFYFKHDVARTEFCLHLQVEPTQLDPIDRTILSLRLCVLSKRQEGK